MAFAVVLDREPEAIVAGESVSWLWSDSRFPAPTWVLTYTLVNAAGRVQIVAGADGASHLVEVSAAVTGAYTAGRYDWQAHVSNGTERYQVGAGVIEVVSDYAGSGAGSGLDGRSFVKRTLDLLEAVIEGRASKTQMSQSVGGVAVSHIPLETLVMLRDKFAKKYQRELVRTGKAVARTTVLPRFRN